MTKALYTAEGIFRVNKRINTKYVNTNVNTNVGKLWKRNVNFCWDNGQIKSKFRLTKDNFNIILSRIEASIVKTNFVPEPIEPNRQLGLTIYKLAHSCTFTVIGNVFGISNSLASQPIHFAEYVKIPSSEQEWFNEIKTSLKTMNSRVLELGTVFMFLYSQN